LRNRQLEEEVKSLKNKVQSLEEQLSMPNEKDLEAILDEDDLRVKINNKPQFKFRVATLFHSYRRLRRARKR
jgi:hypothetical protein